MATRVRFNEFNHDELACDVARDFRVAYRDVEALYGPAAMRRIPLFGVGHSLGAKVHVLLNCYPEVVDVARRRKVCCVRDAARAPQCFSQPCCANVYFYDDLEALGRGGFCDCCAHRGCFLLSFFCGEVRQLWLAAGGHAPGIVARLPWSQ